ncbi:MAG: PEP-CTERM sorting domain-containing protein [Telluria sp.]
MTLLDGSGFFGDSFAMDNMGSGSFGGAVMLAPVPEPETYGMMLAGLGLGGLDGTPPQEARGLSTFAQS